MKIEFNFFSKQMKSNALLVILGHEITNLKHCHRIFPQFYHSVIPPNPVKLKVYFAPDLPSKFSASLGHKWLIQT